MKQNKAKTEKPYSVDELMLNTASALVRDFREFSDDPTLYSSYGLALQSRNIELVRKEAPRPREGDTVMRYKRDYQLASLFKRYRFKNDLFSDDELLQKTVTGFLDNQERITRYSPQELPNVFRHILQRARGYMSLWLGDYSQDEHIDLCRFGRRATVGVSSRKACEAERYEIPITGSKAHITWFSRIYLERDKQAMKYILAQMKTQNIEPFKEIEHLALTLVPKTFKSLRGIMPNTTIGSFYTDGLGKVLTRRLQRIGYDITTLQKRHGELAKTGSITGKLVTADQSMASDNITLALVKELFPTEWFDVLNLGRIGVYQSPDGTKVESSTFCTMGIGFTFPLQTLVFLSLLKAISVTYGRGDELLSVYGDDLIYDVDLHPFVVTIFERLGLKINVDKTFSSGAFRESCGSDYYHGVDVRPFSFQNEAGSDVDRKNYVVTLYKIINGLRRRWLDLEIQETLKYLALEVARCSRVGILRVPLDYPDGSGIKCSSLGELSSLIPDECFAPVKRNKHGVYSFKYLRFVADTRKETRHEPFLWRHLGGDMSDGIGGSDYHRDIRLEFLDSARRIERELGLSTARPLFTERRAEEQLASYRSEISGRWLERVDTLIAKNKQGTILSQTGVSSLWTP
jgi:hypothetical protein